MCPFSILAFLQPTTVDKEPEIRLITIRKIFGLQIRQRISYF